MRSIALAVALTAATLTAHATDKERKKADPSVRPAAAAPAKPAVRNWAEIDTNRDHLISAEEMETWLAAQRKK